MTAPGLRIAFAGTPVIAATVLSRVLAEPPFRVVQVFTQPDRPAGRGRHLAQSAVKDLALAHGLPISQPERASDMDPEGALGNVDVLLVVAYGLLLPPEILDRTRLGAINVHLSLLPRWRGAAPIQRAIEAGDATTGVTIMQMDAGLDTGPILLQAACPIAEDDTAGSLQERLASLGAEHAVRALAGLAAGTLVPVPQDSHLATYAAKLKRAEARIDWNCPAAAIVRRIRAFNPWPICHTRVGDTEFRILRAHALDDVPVDLPPGSICGFGSDGIDVTSGDGVVRIDEMQLPGRRPTRARDVCNGRPRWLHQGARMEPK